MPLKFTNKDHTAATFNGASFGLAAPEDFTSIGDGPTREAVLAWLAAGNVPEDFVAPAKPAVVRTVTMRQARMALHLKGLLPQVESALYALPSGEREAARIEWEYSQAVQQDRPFVQRLAAALKLTPAQLDDLFTLAASL